MEEDERERGITQEGAKFFNDKKCSTGFKDEDDENDDDDGLLLTCPPLTIYSLKTSQ